MSASITLRSRINMDEYPLHQSNEISFSLNMRTENSSTIHYLDQMHEPEKLPVIMYQNNFNQEHNINFSEITLPGSGVYNYDAQRDEKRYQSIKHVQQIQETKNIQLKNIMNNGTTQSEKEEFKWKGIYHTKFSLACLALGIKNATPKVLKSILDFEVSRESIGSHLQKYRQAIVKDNNLANTKQLTNKCFAKSYPGIDERLVDHIKRQWKIDVLFQGCNPEDVKKLVRDLNVV